VSLVFHRPQSAGELLDVSLGVVKRHAAFLFRLGMWPVLGIAAIDLISRALPESSALGLMMLPLSFVVYSIGEAGVSFAAWQLLHRRPVDAAAVWTRVRQCFGSVTVGYTLKWMGVLLGLVFFIVPGALLLVRWFAVPAANVQIFVTIGLLDVGMTLGSIVLAAAAVDDTTSELPLWFSLASWAFTMFYLLYHATLSTALYANARVRNEGYDVEDLFPAATEVAG
jgi:hypothetical protein